MNTNYFGAIRISKAEDFAVFVQTAAFPAMHGWLTNGQKSYAHWPSSQKNKRRGNMYKNRAVSGKNNISGSNIARIRKGLHPKVSQRLLADRMQLEGIELDKNAIQRIESSARFITDIELKTFAKVLNVSYEELLME